MQKQHVSFRWCRYADDGLVHGNTELDMQNLLVKLNQRFQECGLTLHPEKTKIVYCSDGKRRKSYPNKEITFLGYTFRGRLVKNRRNNSFFVSFSPAVSKEAQKSMRAKTRKMGFSIRSDLSLQDIASIYNPVIRGWIEYYGCYNRSSLNSVFGHLNAILIAWARRKYKKLRKHKTRAARFIGKIIRKDSQLFAHWKIGMTKAFI